MVLYPTFKNFVKLSISPKGVPCLLRRMSELTYGNSFETFKDVMPPLRSGVLRIVFAASATPTGMQLR
jgi:hypothetical protein